jgi:hypothetical protein
LGENKNLALLLGTAMDVLETSKSCQMSSAAEDLGAFIVHFQFNVGAVQCANLARISD